MALRVQDTNGLVAKANAYITVAEFLEYHQDRGTDVDASIKDPAKKTQEIESAIVRATDYVDERFSYIGERFNYEQTTQFPRSFNPSQVFSTQERIPTAVKEAVCEYAMVALSQELNPIPYQDITTQTVIEKKEKVGTLEEVTKYAEPVANNVTKWPSYPRGDQKLLKSGYVVSGVKLVRT